MSPPKCHFNTGAAHTKHSLSLLPQATSGTNSREEVFTTLMFFAETALLMNVDEELRRGGGEDVEMAKKAIAGLSFLANRHDYLFDSARLQEFFKRILAGVSPTFPREIAADLQCIIIDCINDFLVDEAKTALANDTNCENLLKSPPK